jgi:hypothetical protein
VQVGSACDTHKPNKEPGLTPNIHIAIYPLFIRAFSQHLWTSLHDVHWLPTLLGSVLLHISKFTQELWMDKPQWTPTFLHTPLNHVTFHSSPSHTLSFLTSDFPRPPLLVRSSEEYFPILGDWTTRPPLSNSPNCHSL